MSRLKVSFVLQYFSRCVQSRAKLQKQRRSDVELSEGLTAPGIMWAQLMTTLKPLGTSQYCRIEGFKADP